MTKFPVHTIESAPERSKPALRQLQSAFGMIPNITGVMANGTYPTTITPAQLQRNANMMRQFGQLKGAFDVNQLLGG